MAKGKKKLEQARARQETRQAAKAEAERIKAAQVAKERRNRLMTIGGLLAVVLVVVIIVLVVTSQNKTGTVDEITSRPVAAQDNGGVLLGQDLVPGGTAPSGNDAVTVAIYSDFMCPGCGNFEKNYSSQLADMAKNGSIQIEMHLLSNLDSVDKADRYSTRSAVAAAAVGKYDPANYWAFVTALFNDQPVEGEETRTDEQIAETAKGAGVSEEAISHFKDADFEKWVEYSTKQASVSGVRGTPSVQLGLGKGKRETFTGYSTIGFEQGVANVRAGLPANG